MTELRARVTRVGGPAVWALRTYWVTVALLVAAATAAVLLAHGHS